MTSLNAFYCFDCLHQRKALTDKGGTCMIGANPQLWVHTSSATLTWKIVCISLQSYLLYKENDVLGCKYTNRIESGSLREVTNSSNFEKLSIFDAFETRWVFNAIMLLKQRPFNGHKRNQKESCLLFMIWQGFKMITLSKYHFQS